MSYYDTDGTPISLEDWSKGLNDLSKKRVAYTPLPDGKIVSTVWLGLDPRFGMGKPLIFQTMVFPSEQNFSELDCRRYNTLVEARVGHIDIVQEWMNKQGEPTDSA